MEIDILPDIGRPPEFGFPETPEMMVDRVSFGDGYELRRPAGLNSVKRVWSPVWRPLTEDQRSELYEFLLSRQGVYAFLFQPKQHDDLVKVVATGVKWEQIAEGRFFMVSATLTEDFGL